MVKRAFYNLKSILGLSLSLAKANFKIRNEGSYLGILWYLLEPLLLFVLILSLQPYFFSSSIQKYPLYLLLGLIMFNFFSQATNFAVTSISGNRKFIISMKIRKEALVIATFLQTIFSHIFEITILIVFFILYNHSILSLSYYPFVFIFFGIFTLGVCFILATLGVFIKDVNNVWRVFTRLLWFATPIFYIVKEPVSNLFLFNPVYYYIEIARGFILGSQVNSFFIILSLFFSIVVFIIGIVIFHKYKNKFAEIV